MQNILRFIRAAREYPGVTRNYIVSQLLLLATVALQLLIPFMIRVIIDDGIAQRDLELVFRTAFWMAVFSLVAAVTSGISAYYSVGFAVDSAHEIRVRSYEKIGTLSFGNLDRFQTSDLLVRLTSDVNIVKQMIMYVTFFFFRAPFTLIGAIGLVFLTSPSLFWILVVVLLFTAVLMWIYARYAQPLYTAVQTKLDWLNRVLQENLAGVRVVKAFVRAEHEEHRFDDRNVVLRETAVKPMRLLSFLQPALFLVLNLGTIGALWFGGDQVVNSGDATVGEVITFTNYLLTAMIPMVILAILLPEIARAEASMKRIFQVIDAEPDIREKPDAKPMPEIEGHVVFENVSFSYLRDDGTPTDRPVLKGINLQARPGEVVALLGATGSGKSSLIHLIPRFYDVTEGRVAIDGVDVRDMRLQDLRSHIGIALQQAILFSGVVRDNIRYGRPEATQDDVEQVAKVADADGFITAQVEGYDARVAREGANFSGGQRQRISIARALAIKPKILILDDSTSAVDVATETRIQAALQELLTGTTTFIVAQRISTVLVADKIVILDNGEIVAEGNHKELLDTSPLYREIYESQLGSLEDAR